jgi:TusA-related sulfurtransferase
MPRITRDSLMTLEAYAKARKDFRAKVMAHKKLRAVHLGEHLTLLFEDELTIRYQIQEILRVEKSFEEQAIQDELDAYNPLVPDGHNWKATVLVEYEDVEERKQALAKLKGVEDRVWVQVGSLPRVYAIADEDLERENAEKTSAVHFVRFELTRSMVSELRRGSALFIGVDHPAYTFTLREVPEPTRRALLGDLSGD